MKALDKDRRILAHIISYCDQIDMAVEQFGNYFSVFSENPVYRNAVSLCILQIGELAGNLSDDFKAQHPAVPWRQIKLMRNIVAHRYGTVDHSLTWDVVEHDIPVLRQYCQSILNPET
jgi:uncharacterized protein with HEPN domain